MQYWLIGYGPTCPSGWNSFQNSCFKNSPGVAIQDGFDVRNLNRISTSGSAAAGGMDVVTVDDGTNFHISAQDTVLHLAGGWTSAEFNVFGFGNGSQANFNSGATLAVKLTITDGTSGAPDCVNSGTTGETSNLTLVPSSCCPVGGASPAISFLESNATSVPSAPFCLLNDIVPIVSPVF
jgi:hypothetical protein